MSQSKASQDDLNGLKLNMPPPKKIPRKKRRTNQVSTPPPQSPTSSSGRKPDVIEMFAIKPKKSSSTFPKSSSNENLLEEMVISVDESQDTSDISDDVFLAKRKNYSPVDSIRTTNSRSDTKSYREKINDRFKSIKDKAGKSTKKANRFKDITETFLMEKIRSQSDCIDAELEQFRSKLSLRKTDNIADFFLSESSQNQSEEHKIEIGDEDVTKSAEVLINENVTIFHLPETLNFTLKLSEKDLLFRPKSNIVDIQNKVDYEPISLQDEGFYVPEKIKMPQSSINLLEQRLSQDSKRWFNCEGNLDVLENPVIKLSSRPQLRPTKVSGIFCPATLIGDECEEIVVVRDDILKLEISNLKFTHHPLCSLEHYYAEKLRTLYEEHERNYIKNSVERSKQRLKATILIKNKLEESSQCDKIEKYINDIKKLKQELLEEATNERIRIKKMLTTWKRIKNIRETRKYSNTSVKLSIGKTIVDKESETAAQKSFFNLLDPPASSSSSNLQDEDFLKQLKNNLKPPGEPKLTFILTEDNEITLNDTNNPQEITRRQVVSSTKLSLRVLCSKVEVCKTKFVNLSENFVCSFNETIYIQLTTIPKFLTIQIIEQPKALIKRTVGEISIKIPSQSSLKEIPEKEYFEKLELVHYKHDGVGSGIKLEEIDKNLDPLLDEDCVLKTSGFITYCVKWEYKGRDENVKTDQNPAEYDEIIDKIVGKSGEIYLDKLSDWLDQDQLDPQDPKNSIFFQYCADNGFLALPTKNHHHFRLSPHSRKFQFCKTGLIEHNLRLTILQLRDRNEPEFDSMTVPNRIKEIPANILEDYTRRINGDKQTEEEEDEDEHEMENIRNKGRKKLKQIHVKVFQTCKNSRNNLTFEDVVDEKFLIHFEKFVKTIAGSFMNWFKWSPVKQPMLQFKTEHKIDSKTDCKRANTLTKIIIKVIAAVNVPKRIESQGEIKPFVEVDFENFISRTSSEEGPNPTWNEEMILPLDSVHSDYLNPNALNNNLIIDLFDEGDKELAKYGGVKSKTWLGCVEIPLSAISSNGLQGMFKVRTPHLVLGYESELDRNTKSPKPTQIQTHHQTFLNLNISLESDIPKMNPCLEELPCGEVPYLKDHILKWNQSYNYKYPSRKFSAFAIDSNASTTCIIRYIKAVEPPQINAEGFDVTPEQCAKFISLVPFANTNNFYQHIWLSVNEFLQFMVGSIIDHAVILTCYLLALKLEAWLLLGFGVPNGSTAYVLIREYDNNEMPSYYIFDAASGEKFYLTDAFCPLQKVYCIVNDNNIWANIQRGDNVDLLRFDLNRKTDWLPLFQNDIPSPSNSVHGRLVYLPHFDGTTDLELSLERKIRKKVSKLRQLDRTIWNHNVSDIFKSALSSFENYSMFGKNHLDTLLRLKSSIRFSWVKGLVVNLPFTSVSKIVKQVRSYGIHLQDGSVVEFASAVYLRSYQNQAITVWIFLACFSDPEM